MGSCQSMHSEAGGPAVGNGRRGEDTTNAPVHKKARGVLLAGLLDPAAIDGRVRRTSRGSDVVFKPVFPHRSEYPADQRTLEVLRAVAALPLGTDPESTDKRGQLLHRWANAPRSPLPAARLEPLHAGSGNDAHPLAANISLAEVDRGSREAPFCMGSCTTNLSSVWIRSFNVVKLFLHHEGNNGGPSAPDELLNAMEFHMLLSYAAYYLVVMVLVDASAPMHAGVDAAAAAPTEGTTACAEEIRDGSCNSAPGFHGAARPGPFLVSSLFFDKRVTPLLLSSCTNSSADSDDAAVRRLCACLPKWASSNDVPASFRQLFAGPSASIFRELDALVPTPSERRSPKKRDSLTPRKSSVDLDEAEDACCPSQELCDYISRALLATAFLA